MVDMSPESLEAPFLQQLRSNRNIMIIQDRRKYLFIQKESAVALKHSRLEEMVVYIQKHIDKSLSLDKSVRISSVDPNAFELLALQDSKLGK